MRVCRRWTEQEKDLMREFYSLPLGVEHLMGILKRSRASLWIQAQRMGLRHYQFFLRGAKGIKGNKGDGAKLSVEALRLSTTPNVETGCWEWRFGRSDAGYGKITVNRKTILAHRQMFSLAFPGMEMSGMNVCHHCDNPCCVNPDHLYLGTQSENIKDCVRRGRHRWQRAMI